MKTIVTSVAAVAAAMRMSVSASAGAPISCAAAKSQNISNYCAGKTGEFLADCQKRWDNIEKQCLQRESNDALAAQRIAIKRAKEAADRAASRAARQKPPVYNSN